MTAKPLSAETWIKPRPDPLGCYDCGRPYGSAGFPDLVIPDDAWRAISPTGDDGGLLCPSCLCARLAISGITCPGSFMSGPLVANLIEQQRDASRAETAAVVRERDEARADQATLDRVLAAFGIANTGLDAGNYAEALCVGLEQMRSLAADLVEGLGPFAWVGQWLFARDLPDDTPVATFTGLHRPAHLTRGMFKAAHTLLTRAAALGVKPRDGEKEKGNG